MTPDDQKVLLQQIAAGDTDAFATLVAPFRERLFRKACSILGSAYDAEDALQDSLLTGFRAIDRFRGEASIYTWLYRIVVNRCTDIIRKRTNEHVDYIDPFEFDVEDTVDIEKNHELSDNSTYLMSQIQELDDRFRELIIMRYFDDLSYEEIAQIKDLKVGTVKSRLFKARELLKRRIFQDEGGRQIFEQG